MVSNGIYSCIPIWCKIKADHELAEIGLVLRRPGYEASASHLHTIIIFVPAVYTYIG